MSNNCNTITEILLQGGTDRLRRTSKKLDPASIELHGFGLEEWMAFAYNFASHVKYFDAQSNSQDGFWTEFFKDEAATEALLADLEESDRLTPHLTLFICFLRLLEFSSDRLNGITKRHLDFYYQDVLQIEKLPPVYDKVNVIFELAKNSLQAKLEAGIRLNGGKDNNGTQRFYELLEETVVNGAQLTDFKSFYFDPDYTDPSSGITTPQYYMKASNNAQTIDGLEEALTEDQSTWYGFGYNHNRVDDPFVELPDANIGFAVSSKALNMAEGTRHAQFEISFGQSIDTITDVNLIDQIKVSYTNAEGWSEDLALKSAFSFTINTSSELYETNVNTTTNKVKLLVELPDDLHPTAVYNESIHGLKIEAEGPVFRFKVDTNSQGGLNIYKQFIKKVNKIDIDVHVSGVRTLKLDNDLGTLNPEKPMFPFTNTPVKGSSFSIVYEETFNKDWEDVQIDVAWKNAPDNFVTWYDAYRQAFASNFDPKSYVLFKNPIAKTPGGVEIANIVSLPVSINNRIVNGQSYFKAERFINRNGAWADLNDNVTLFLDTPTQYSTSFGFNQSDANGKDTEGLRISLNQSFLHEMYPKLYATALLTINTENEAPLPNEPYSPLTESVVMSYTASDTIVLNVATEDQYAAADNAFYHEDAFGFARRHPYLRSVLDFLPNNNVSLVPVHCRGGELYIGIEGAENLQNINLLIQVLEGSENKQTPTFLGNQGVTWEIMASNYWKKLDATLLLKNTTDNFLQTGLVQFKIPKEATDNNTRLPNGKFWIRAKMLKSFDAVCQIIGIHSQVGTAQFVDNNNELSHLEKGLEAGTITKLFQRSAEIKSVEQPYNSFNGSPEESDAMYYQRVSERLRHKNRAITLWDYEHIVLQEFKDLFRVKCLNHTSPTSFTAAGNVTLIVIPDTVNKNVFNRFQPRVSTAFLNRVDDFVSKLTSLHVKVRVENPIYEEVTITTKVKFREGLDETLYKNQLNEDIIKFLSPWAFDETQQVDFGQTLHISVLINYIEQLNYVDYLQDVAMSIDGGSTVKEYTPSTPKAIMVSATEHNISTDIITCEPITEIITEECQQ
ncbi:MAG: baseplate J/gp47 family protein [Fluviicola sp.]